MFDIFIDGRILNIYFDGNAFKILVDIVDPFVGQPLLYEDGHASADFVNSVFGFDGISLDSWIQIIWD